MSVLFLSLSNANLDIRMTICHPVAPDHLQKSSSLLALLRIPVRPELDKIKHMEIRLTLQFQAGIALGLDEIATAEEQ